MVLLVGHSDVLHRDAIVLQKLYTSPYNRDKHNATRTLRKLKETSNKYKKPILLTIEPIEDDGDFLKHEQLKNFYIKNGFIDKNGYYVYYPNIKEYLDTIYNQTAMYLVDYLKGITIEEFTLKISELLGYKNIKYLDSGGMGIAYAVSDNTKILKITWDEWEAKNAFVLKNVNTYRIINYYDVRKLESNHIMDKSIKLYVLISDRVKPLIKDSLEHKLINNMLDLNFDKKTQNYKNHFFIRGSKNNSIQNVIDNIDFIKPDNADREKCISIVKEYFKMVEECIKYNIGFFDLHADNIGYGHDGQLVFFDVGNDSNFYDFDLNKIPVLNVD